MLSRRRRAFVEAARVRARAVKAAAFAPAPPGDEPRAVSVSQSRLPALIRRGLPCTTLNDEFRDLLDHEGLSAARVLASDFISLEIAGRRLAACRWCAHASVFQDGFMRCECHQCNRWRPPQVLAANDLRELVKHAKFLCPSPGQTFGQAFGLVNSNCTAETTAV